MRIRGVLVLAAVASLVSFQAWAGGGDEAPEATEVTAAAEAVPEFNEAYLGNPENYVLGKEVWVDQCRHCHGKSAYPGKAPKLKPRRYKADFVFDRVTNGFRKMPAWGEVFSLEERMSVVAYILSQEFSP